MQLLQLEIQLLLGVYCGVKATAVVNVQSWLAWWLWLAECILLYRAWLGRDSS